MNKKEAPAIEKRLYTIPETAAYLNISKRTIYNQLSLKTFPVKAKRLGRLIRFDIRDLERFIEAQ